MKEEVLKLSRSIYGNYWELGAHINMHRFYIFCRLKKNNSNLLRFSILPFSYVSLNFSFT